MLYKGQSIYNSSNLSLNLNYYEFEDIINDVTFYNGFDRRNTPDEFVRFYPSLYIVSINLIIYRSTIVNVAGINDDWLDVLGIINNKFYFSDYNTPEQKPTGVLGMQSGAMLSQGSMTNDGGTILASVANIVTSSLTGNKRIGMKNLIDPNSNCHGVTLSRAYSVVMK